MGKKTLIGTIQAAVTVLEKKLSAAQKLEAQARKTWTRLHHGFVDASEALADLVRHGTKREAALKAVVKAFRARSADLTKARDDTRDAVRAIQEELAAKQRELDRVMAEEKARCQATDEVVGQVFALNAAVVQASIAREGYVTAHVFPHLLDAKGNLRSQVTFTSTDGLKRVMARVNTITIVSRDLAERALTLIDAFKERVRPDPAITDPTTTMLFELTDRLLIQRTAFKVGPDLYRFLRLDLDRTLFPELVEAQNLLKQSIRSEKTESYIRLWQRASTTAKWKPVRQS